MDDCELLHEYVAHHSEQAFAQLVERHLPLVYAIALRVVREPQAAEDVAQAVFIDLARKAGTVRKGQAVSGWLYRATQRDALNFLRSEKRRQQRETAAMNLAEKSSHPEIIPEQLAPLLEQAIGQLGRVEQDAVVLRYFEGKSLRETGEILAMSEDAARKRVDRALDKMRAYFAKSGITASAALLVSALSAHAALAPVPSGLAVKVAGASVAGAAGNGGISHVLEKIFFMSTKIKIAVVVVAVGVAYTAGRSPELFFGTTKAESENLPQNRLTRQVASAGSQNSIAVGDVAYSSALDSEILQMIAKGPTLGMAELAELPPGARKLNAYNLAFADWADDPAQAPGVASAAYALDDGIVRPIALRGAIDGWAHSDVKAALDWVNKLAPTDSEPLKDALLGITNGEGNPQLAAQYVNNFQDASVRNQVIESIARSWAFDNFGNVNDPDPSAALDWLNQVATGDTYDNNVEYIVTNVTQHNPATAAALLGKVSDTSVRNTLMANVATTWAGINRAAALAWLQTLPDSDATTRDTLVQKLTSPQTETSTNSTP